MDYDSDEELKELLLACVEKEKKGEPRARYPTHLA